MTSMKIEQTNVNFDGQTSSDQNSQIGQKIAVIRSRESTRDRPNTKAPEDHVPQYAPTEEREKRRKGITSEGQTAPRRVNVV